MGWAWCREWVGRLGARRQLLTHLGLQHLQPLRQLGHFAAVKTTCGREEAGTGARSPSSPWSPSAPVGGMEGADRHLTTPVHERAQHREGAAENYPSRVDHACMFLPEQDQGPKFCSLCIQNDSFPVSRGRKSCCFPPRWGWPRLAGFGDRHVIVWSGLVSEMPPPDPPSRTTIQHLWPLQQYPLVIYKSSGRFQSLQAAGHC